MLCCAVLCCAGLSEASFDPPSFDFSPYRGHYQFAKDNSSSSLVGRYYDNHTETGDIENALSVLVEFEDSGNGQWRTGRDEDSLTQLFPFSFVQHPAGHPTSVGDWHGQDDSYYVLQINAPDRFTITVQPKRAKQRADDNEDEAEEGVVIYSLRKKAEPAAKTFFQQYGTWLMLGVFFVVNMSHQQPHSLTHSLTHSLCTAAAASTTKRCEAHSRLCSLAAAAARRVCLCAGMSSLDSR